MNTDGVTTAFQLISDEIENVAEGIAGPGAKAFRERRPFRHNREENHAGGYFPTIALRLRVEIIEKSISWI